MSYARSIPLILLFSVLVGPVLAQRPDTTCKDNTGREVEKKDPSRASFYSGAGTILLAPAFGAGLVVGPALGHFYADNSSQAWTGIGLRTGGALVGFLGANLAFGASWEGNQALATVGEGLVVVGLGTVAISGLYDIVTADNSAREYNREHEVQANLVPTAEPTGGQVGLALAVRF